MKNLLKDLYNHKIMTKEEAKNVLFSLTDGSANNSQIASFLTVFCKIFASKYSNF